MAGGGWPLADGRRRPAVIAGDGATLFAEPQMDRSRWWSQHLAWSGLELCAMACHNMAMGGLGSLSVHIGKIGGHHTGGRLL